MRLGLKSPDAALRRACLAEQLRQPDAEPMLRALESLLEAGERTDPEARSLLLDLTEVLGGDPDLRAAWSERAQRGGAVALARWLVEEGARDLRPLGPTDSARARGLSVGLRDGRGRVLTLGEKKTLARRSPPELLGQLLRDADAAVVARALVHPRLTEDLLVTVMSRRPGSQVLLAEVAAHARWMQRARVRTALVAHPDTPRARAILVVPLLLRQELSLVLEQPRVPAAVRAACNDRLQRLPPLAEPDHPGPLQ